MHGVAVSGGVAVGYAHLVTHAKLEAAHYVVAAHEVAEEVQRFDAAIKNTRAELAALGSGIPAHAPAEFEAFLNLHLMILDDATLSAAPRNIIETEHCNAEWALKVQTDALLAQFDEIEDGYLRERKVDVIQVVERVMKALSGQPGHVPSALGPEQSVVLVAHDLSPADVIQFKQHHFASFLTDLGGTTSHTAVVARSLNIPSVVALHHARALIRENDLLIVDGTQGVVIVDPDSQVLAEYRQRQNAWDLEKRKLKRLRKTPAATLDGSLIELQANIELPEDIVRVEEAGATGIGLFRTEFLYLNRDDLPDEEEQFVAYRSVAEAMRGLPVTIRTYDLGADKHIEGAERVTTNPALGLRAIRLCLTEPQRFRVQLRALLRASPYGKLRILIPMLCNAAELAQTLHLIQLVKQELDGEGVQYDRGVEIGTNDLIQYTLAVDRTDDSVAYLYDPLHPAVIKLIAHVIRGANRASVPIALCGEMAGDVALTRLLLGFGLRQFSMHPAQVLAVKQQVLRTTMSEVTALAHKMLKADEPDKMQALLERLNA